MASLTVARAHTLLCVLPGFLFAQPSRREIAKASQNPISSMASVPLQNNFNFGTGDPVRTQYVLNVQPVVPLALTKELLFVPRLNAPFVSQPVGADSSESGLGDTRLELLLAKRASGSGYYWGVGPAVMFPTASETRLGSERWNAGAAVVGVVVTEHWVTGLLVDQQWSYAGDRLPVAPLVVQPFINYNTNYRLAVIATPIITADWLKPDDAWVVPVGGGVSKVILVGPQYFIVALQAFANLVRPDLAPSWSVRATASFLFPKHSPKH